MVAIGPNFFYTVTLPVTLWFLDRGKRGTPREDTVLFLDARDTYPADRPRPPRLPARADRAAREHRAPLPRRGAETVAGSEELMAERFPDGAYVDVPGFCKVATIEEIEAQGWSLNPGRYVGVAAGDEDDGDFAERLAELHDEFTVLSRRSGGVAAQGRRSGAGDSRRDERVARRRRWVTRCDVTRRIRVKSDVGSGLTAAIAASHDESIDIRPRSLDGPESCSLAEHDARRLHEYDLKEATSSRDRRPRIARGSLPRSSRGLAGTARPACPRAADPPRSDALSPYLLAELARFE